MSIDFRSMGLQKEQQNDLLGAESIYKQWIESDSIASDAWFRLGVVCLKQNRLSESQQCFETVLALSPQFAEAWCNLGIVQARTKHLSEAERSFINAVNLNPNRADFFRNLAGVQSELGNTEQAIRAFAASIQLDPDHAPSHFRLGQLLRNQGQKNEASHHFLRTLQLSPGHVPCMCELAEMLIEAGREDEAENMLRAIIQIAPDTHRAYSALGILYANQKRYQQAVEAFQFSLKLRPNAIIVWNNLGNALKWLGRVDQAISAFHKSLELHRNYPDTWVNLGSALDYAGRFEESHAAYKNATLLDDQHAVAHHNYALSCLRLKQWELGWKEYEWRWKCEGYQLRKLPLPLWEGEVDHGATILVRCEQGLGDTIQFLRYAQMVKDRCGRVVLECQHSMVSLLATCEGVDHVIAVGDTLPKCDASIPVMSLPRVFGTTPESIPNSCPYLKVDPSRLSQWKEITDKIEGYKIGIIWKGNSRYKLDTLRSVSLSTFEPIARRKHLRLISLQKDGTKDLERCGFEVLDFGDKLDQDGKAFIDTAALMQCVDIVISVDTAAAHIAGALGLPVWLLLSHSPDWRWFLEGSTTPWYPSMRLFRQKGSDWSGVVNSIVDMLP